MVRDSLGGAHQTVTLRVLPDSKIWLSVVFVHREEPPSIFRTHVNGHFVRELVVNLKRNSGRSWCEQRVIGDRYPEPEIREIGS